MATKLGDITLTKQTGTVLTLSTEHKYVNDNISFDIDVQSGAGTVTIASTDASIESDVSGRNISDVIGAKSGIAPVSGYYLKVAASGTGSSAVTTAGWLEEGSIGTASATGSFYFPIDSATASISGTNVVTPSASISGSHVIFGNKDNGISVTATGGGTASVTATASGNQSGYVESGVSIGSNTLVAESLTTTTSTYISGVVLEAPEMGTNKFTISLPDGGSSMLTLTFTVDANGDWTIE